MQVPSVIKDVFDRFPLREYPAVPNTTLKIDDSIISNSFHFGGESSSSGKFTLAVFNVFELQGRLLPTDYNGLQTAFHLCQKNNLTLPRPGVSGSGHSIMKVSYYASPNNFLPMLIEDDEIRALVLYDQIKLMLNKQDAIKDEILGEFLDCCFTDLWLLCLWFQSDQLDLTAILDLPANVVTKHELCESMSSWTGLKIRYGVLEDLVYTRLLSQVSETLQLIEKDKDAVSATNLRKVYAFSLISKSLLSNTKVSDVIPASLEEASVKYVQSM